MIVRVVSMHCKYGKEENLKLMGRERIVPINQKFGCIDVYFLEPSHENNNDNFGVVSIWHDIESLSKMKNSEEYIDLRIGLDELIDSISDVIYKGE